MPDPCDCESSSRGRCECCDLTFNGLIQHSFALRMDDDRRPFHGRDVYERVAERFSIPPSDGNAEFRMRPVGEPVDRHSIRDVAPQSPLVQHDLTTVYPRRMTFLE